MKTKGCRVRTSQIDLIPMIDIVFQLILFFLVSTTFAQFPGISVNLPDSSTAEGGQTASLIITASAEGELWLNEELVTIEQLDLALSEFDTGEIPSKEYPIQLEADSLVTNGTIVKIFDVLRKNGFAAVNLRTRENNSK